ncbi:MAG: T9SS type A sorting domain-containing protein [Bacteroidetes bacterium]|nr:T9SS type A sorting domain-containing protein [Bacteroidota bacterium]
MRLIILAMFFVFAHLQLSAQIWNGSFEEWDGNNNPVGWYTSDMYFTNRGMASPSTISQETDTANVKDSTYAIRLTNRYYNQNGFDGIIPGWVSKKEVMFDTSMYEITINGEKLYYPSSYLNYALINYRIDNLCSVSWDARYISVNGFSIMDYGMHFETDSFYRLIDYGHFSSNGSIETVLSEIPGETATKICVWFTSGSEYHDFNRPLNAVAGNTLLVDKVNITTTPCATGIMATSEQILSFYPNPASNRLHIADNALIETCEVYNTNGTLITKLKAPVGDLDVSGFAAGMYVVHCKTPNGSIVIRKFVKVD